MVVDTFNLKLLFIYNPLNNPLKKLEIKLFVEDILD